MENERPVIYLLTNEYYDYTQQGSSGTLAYETKESAQKSIKIQIAESWEDGWESELEESKICHRINGEYVEGTNKEAIYTLEEYIEADGTLTSWEIYENIPDGRYDRYRIYEATIFA